MFKKFLISVLLLPAVAIAQPVIVDRKILCNRTDLVFAELANSDFKEIPLWVGEGQQKTKTVLVVNQKTRTWTLIQFNETVACLLAAGEDYQLVKTQ